LLWQIFRHKLDSKYNELLTVIPLTSKEHKNHLDLGDEVKNSIYKIMSCVISNANKDINNIQDPFNALEISTDFCDMQIEILKKYASLKEHTYAKVNQITTISKRRIIKPVNVIDPIRRLKISDKALNQIDEKILETFTNIDIY